MAQLLEMPVLVLAARDLGRLAQLRRRRVMVFLLSARRAGSLGGAAMGASGWTSIRVRWVPGGVSTTVRTAPATASGCRKWWWRAEPQRIHSPRTSVVTSGSQSPPISLTVWPGWTIEARTPVPSSSICSVRAYPSRPHFDAT